MPISRRGFLGFATGISAAGFAGAAGLGNLFPQIAGSRAACALVDPGPCCPLRESVAGFEVALGALDVEYRRTSFQSLAPAGTIIFPAAVSTDFSALARVRDHLENGSVVLYESGAAFLGSQGFDYHKRVIRSVFGLSLHDPVALWDSTDSFRQSPYVDYHWPVATKVRDFNRVIPVGAENGEAIARFRNLPVAARRRIGKGTLIFLGSPLGPHLLASDREARAWLGALLSIS